MVIDAFREGLVVDAKPLLEGPPMTDDMMNLKILVEKTPDTDLLREMTGWNSRWASRRSRGGGTRADARPDSVQGGSAGDPATFRLSAQSAMAQPLRGGRVTCAIRTG